MKKTTFWIVLVLSIITIIVSILGICQGKIGFGTTITSCIAVIIFDYDCYAASKKLDWYAVYTKQLESENEELKKAISAKDEAIASYKWQIEALKKKIR